MKQLSHYDIQNEERSFPITIVCDAIRTPENIGMCFRIAESFGVKKIYLHENSPSTDNRIVKKTARNTISQVPHERYSDFNQLLRDLKSTKHSIIGIEVTDKSIGISDYNFTSSTPLVLLLGSERGGIESLDHVDATVAIPMYGRNSSINVIHSLAISLYEVTQQITNNERN